jgi:hypothetical protein
MMSASERDPRDGGKHVRVTVILRSACLVALLLVSAGSGQASAQGPSLWSPLSAAGTPEPRVGEFAFWTGREMLIWGGVGASGAHSDGARYDPTTGQWSPMSTSGAPVWG